VVAVPVHALEGAGALLHNLGVVQRLDHLHGAAKAREEAGQLSNCSQSSATSPHASFFQCNDMIDVFGLK